jgi:5-amino-6-(5-phosphoribosylamino)uracil reductase
MSVLPAPADELRFRRLLPEPGTLTASEILESLHAVRDARIDRPYTMVNFVCSVDGRAAFHGRSAPVSNPGDRAMFHGLREQADAVFAGTGTMRTERYGRMIRDPARRRRRAAHGLAPDPLACLITRSGDVPRDIPLFADEDSRVVVFSPHPVELSGAAAKVENVVLDPGELTLTTMLRRLRADYGVRSLLCEGGPTVFGAMLHEDLVDELFLTISPCLAGGGMDPTITRGPELPELALLEPRWILEHEGALFLRYARRRETG